MSQPHDYGSPDHDWGSAPDAQHDQIPRRDGHDPAAPAADSAAVPPAAPAPRSATGRRSWGQLAIALSPFVALVLFFVVGATGGWVWSWLFFLLVPVTAIVVRGIEGDL